MKRRLCIAMAVCIMGFVGVAEATLVQMDFNGMTAGDLPGQTGGVGLSGAFSGNVTIDVLHATDLAAPAGTNFGLTQSGGTAGVAHGVDPTADQAGAYTAVALTGTVWGTFLANADDAGNNGVGFNSTSSTSSKPGIRFLTSRRLYYWPDSGAVASANNTLLAGTNLILFRIIIDADGSNDDVTIWVNPDVTDLASETPAIAKATSDMVGSSITRVNIISYDAGGNNEVDMVTISDGPNAYTDVTGYILPEAHTPDPGDGAGPVGTPNGAVVDVDLAWKTGADPNGILTYNPAINKHYVYMSFDQNVSADPNLYLVDTVTQC